jgi:hypothetical protein
MSALMSFLLTIHKRSDIFFSMYITRVLDMTQQHIPNNIRSDIVCNGKFEDPV